MNNKAAMFGFSVLAFLVAAVLVIMIFRMLFGGRLRMPGGRTRQARLGIVDAFDLDRQRQLIIVRRDNTEHLIMIGGPNDLVIESEIVRADVRDLREARRDPVLPPTPNNGRIPAPAAAGPGADKPSLPRPVDEPRAPLTATPADARGDGTSEAPRSPTFPLPPRRVPPPERRPTTPPKLPESVSRGDDAPALASRLPAPTPAPSAPMPPLVARPPQPTGPSAAVPMAPAAPAAAPPANPAAAPTVRPPFLKPLTPLSPRPPVRPLPRTTPQAPTIPAAAPLARAVPTQATAAAPGPAAQSPAQQARPAANDALESLEEEMAKLLGRGS